MDDYKIITIDELINENTLNIPKKTLFCHYTKLESVGKILEGRSFWVSSLKSQNDLKEIELHDNDKKRVFILCFCKSQTEKIPLWYLYSGIDGKGIRIDFKPDMMESFINSIKEIYPVINNNVDKEHPLKIKEDFTINYGLVIYKREDKTIKYNGKNYSVENIDYIDNHDMKFFVKDYPWEYEKEFRIVFFLKESLNIDNIDKISVNFEEEVLEKIKLKMAPETEKSDVLNIKGYKELEKIIDSKKTEPSDLKIKMDVLRNNKSCICYKCDKQCDEKYECIVKTL